MALITCPECGREVSDQAPACPHCGLPMRGAPPPTQQAQQQPLQVELVKRGKNTGCMIILVLLFLIFVIVVLFPGKRQALVEDAPSVSTAPASNMPITTAPPPSWAFTGVQGDMRFVLMPMDAKEDAYRAVALEVCDRRPHCYVNFWTDRAFAPSRLPLTQQQVRAQVAGYTQNRVTGVARWGWDCSVFTGHGADECMVKD